jgi:hypothetical protein
VFGVVLTLLVVLVDASIKSRSPAPTRALAAQAWLDRAYAIVGQSNVAGRDLAAILDPTASPSAVGLAGDLAGLERAASGAYQQFQQLRAPAQLQTASGLLATCLLVRADAVTAITGAVRRELSSASSASSVDAASAASTVMPQLQRLEVADQAYLLFAAAIPRSLDAPPPASRWLGSGEVPSATQLAVALISLRSRISLTPVHQLRIEAVSTTPSALATNGSVETLSASNDLTVSVVVGNTGNQPESGLTVTAAISPAAGTASVQNFISSLEPGTARVVSLGYLNPPRGVNVTLTVTLLAAAGSGVPTQTDRVVFRMPTPTTPVTSTTTTGESSSSTTSTTTSGSSASSTTSTPAG